MKIIKLLQLNYISKFCPGFIFLCALQAVCFGQTARFDVSDKIIDFEVGGEGFDRIESVTLVNSASGARQFARSEIHSLGSSGLTGQFFQITADDIPAGFDFEQNPVVLIIVLKPAPNKMNKSIVSIPITPIGVKVEKMPLPRVEADGRDDAEFYVAGEIIAAHDQKPEMSADIKIEREFAAVGLPFLYTPFFEMKTSNTKKDSDKLKFGIKFSNSFFLDGKKESEQETKGKDGVLNSILAQARKQGDERVPRFTQLKKRREKRQYFLFESSAEIESDRHFQVTNFITGQELKWKVRPLILRDSEKQPKANLILTPFIGADMGWNLHSEIARKDKAIARLKAGAVLTFNINKPFGDLIFQSLKWENRFTQRWFLAKEQAYDTDDDNLILRDFGKRPRSHFVSNLEFKLNDYFGPSIIYESGELPPLYKKVDHRIKLGFTYSFKRSALQ